MSAANYDKELLDNVFKMYQTERFGYNHHCMECKKYAKAKGKELINGPLPISHIGSNFQKQEKRLLIVGMVSYNWSDIMPTPDETWSKIHAFDVEEKDKLQHKIENRIFELLTEPEIRYWGYIRYAFEKIYNTIENGFDCIAITNFVHCNNNKIGETADTLPQYVRNYCADHEWNGFIHKEIEVINPTHILALSTDSKYIRFIENKSSEKRKYKAIVHPSCPGRSHQEFTEDIENFLNE